MTIGIDSGYRLVLGERRLRTCKQLGQDTIKVRFVNLDSLLKGELAENEFRKDFTYSECVAIGAAIEAELAQRYGTNQHSKEDAENFPAPKGETRDLVAKATGFGSGKTNKHAHVMRVAPQLIWESDE